MKILILHFWFLIFAVFVSSVIHAQEKSVPDFALFEKSSILNEPFDNNLRGWITDNQYVSGTIGDGHYLLKCKNYKGSTGLSFKAVELDLNKDFEVEAAIRIIKGSGGVIFGMNNKFYHYRVEVDDNRGIFLVKNDTKLDKQFSVSESSVVKKGETNKITLRKAANTFYLFVNDVFVKDFNNIKPEGLMFGFNTGSNSEISADFINISYLEKKSAAMLSENRTSGADSLIINTQTKKQENKIAENKPVFEIKWLSPSAEKIEWLEYNARVKANVKSSSRLEKVLFYVNGVSVGESEFQPVAGSEDTYLIERMVNLNPGENSFYFVATNSGNESEKSPVRYIVNPESTPPVISWENPGPPEVIVSSDQLTIQACIGSAAALRSVKIMVNGESQGEDNIFTMNSSGDCSVIWKRPIILKEGENSIYIIANNIAGPKTSEKRIIRYQKTIEERRIALVLGNSEYANGAGLMNPVNDANLIESTLKDLGFDVIKKVNIGRDSMMNTIRNFSRKLSSYNVALFYYAGHGVQVEGVNYLIPIDAKLHNKEDCKWEAVAVNTVTDEFNLHGSNTNIVILDACRNNPFRSWARGGEMGFKALAPVNGTIISFATSEGATASDGNSSNGIFTEELVKQMVVPQQIENVFKNTRKFVMERTKKQQVPTEWSYLTGDFYFKK